MWVSAGILAVAVIIVIKEVPYLLRKRLKKELLVFSILLLFGTGLSIAQGLHKDIPNPMDRIAFVYKRFSDFIFSFLT
ncbi:hypothetical protein CVD25_21730 [Bacillus canaveralius]|uniref:Uncharacterized protein n=1 Tax=Bacillus canaveralius TaxID=1403243 RepID=A0A2N5GIB9_9BACI|nr:MULTISPECIES: hypothetical protein [Bacillus]PLR80695.1 hypothetical protein CU635_17580 [Bacillus canaveralius]PLR83853.1 hypothetical protein CVD23_13320 [Bacillus sp. V33-4]PLR89112.1 hypothetical protein CVD25_21730 [Bacillus canaveralius]RSK48174.1 hypothetical protein EJA13_16920 [Bacillus canaveralius]